MRLALTAVMTLGLAAGATAAPVPAPGPAEAVYRELGLPVPDKSPGVLPKEYLPDGVTAADLAQEPEKCRLRKAVLDAVAKLKKYRQLSLEVVVEGEGDEIKKQVRKVQEEPALAILELEEGIRELDEARAADSETPPRWQAHAEYLAAEARITAALWHEFNLLLGHVITERTPPLAADQDRWVLVRAEKMHSQKAVKDMVEKARKELDGVIRLHPGTPWARLAETERKTMVGLQWQPAAPPKK